MNVYVEDHLTDKPTIFLPKNVKSSQTILSKNKNVIKRWKMPEVIKIYQHLSNVIKKTDFSNFKI